MKPFTYYCQTPTIDQLCNLYGPCLHRLPRIDRATILCALSEVNVMLVDGANAEALEVIAQQHGHVFADHENLMQLLRQLDDELTPERCPSLIMAFSEGLIEIQDGPETLPPTPEYELIGDIFD